MDKKFLSHVHVFKEEITSFAVMQLSLHMYVGDYAGNVSVLKLDKESCNIVQMKYCIPLSASHASLSDVYPYIQLDIVMLLSHGCKFWNYLRFWSTKTQRRQMLQEKHFYQRLNWKPRRRKILSPRKRIKIREEELKHEIEHDVEERKLEEKLEYQRQIAEEDKHTNLAKQNKHAVASIAEEMEDMDVACSTDLGPGLRNVGENNCFINVIVQSLWHFRTFRGKFLRRSTPAHAHIKDPCIVCKLHGIFTALREAKEGYDAVSPATVFFQLHVFTIVGRVLKSLHIKYLQHWEL